MRISLVDHKHDHFDAVADPKGTGEWKTIYAYQLLHHLSQIHTTNYRLRLYRKKAT